MTLPTFFIPLCVTLIFFIILGILKCIDSVKNEEDKERLNSRIDTLQSENRQLEARAASLEQGFSDLAGYLELNTDISDLMIESLAKQLNELKGGKQ